MSKLEMTKKNMFIMFGSTLTFNTLKHCW